MPRRPWRLSTSVPPTAPTVPSSTSASRCPPVAWWRCSGPTAPGSPRWPGWSPACCLAPTGSISVGGRDVTGLPAYKIARAGVAHVPEGRGIFASLSVEENLVLTFRQRAGRQSVAGSLARAYEAFPVLGERRKQRGGTLSGGQQRLLSLAKVLVVPPKLLVADELSLGLAPVVVDAVYEGLREINRAGTALLVVEQQVDRVLSLAQEAVVLEHGAVAFDGPSCRGHGGRGAGAGGAWRADDARGSRPGGWLGPRCVRGRAPLPALAPREGPAREQPRRSSPGRRDTRRGGAMTREAVIVDVLRTTFGKRGARWPTGTRSTSWRSRSPIWWSGPGSTPIAWTT